MSNLLKSLYSIQKKDIRKAGAVLANAFQNDPFWKKMLKIGNLKQRQVFYETPVRYCLKFGEVYSSSENLEGIGAWVLNKYADMTIGRALRSGSACSFFRMGRKMAAFTLKMKNIFEPLEADRKENMKDRNYLYFMIIGTANENQGKGHGKKIIEALIEKSESMKLPVYLETTTPKNIKMYENFGFKVIHKVDLPIIELPQWSMIRECQSK